MQQNEILQVSSWFYGFFILLSLVVLLFRQGLSFFHPVAFDTWIRWSSIACLMALVVVWLSRFLSNNLSWAKKLEDEFTLILGPLHRRETVLLAIISSVGEELAFRGVLQPKLGLWLTSLLFGLIHFPVKSALIPWTFFALFMGLVLGFLYQESGSLWPPVLLHFLVNEQNMAYMTRRFRNLPSVSSGPRGEGREEDRIESQSTNGSGSSIDPDRHAGAGR